jgi:Cu+-exporting ATPase
VVSGRLYKRLFANSHPNFTNEIQLLGRHNMAVDPVCNMEVDERDTKFNSQYGNQTYYFCSEECKDTFDNKPEQFAVSAA